MKIRSSVILVVSACVLITVSACAPAAAVQTSTALPAASYAMEAAATQTPAGTMMPPSTGGETEPNDEPYGDVFYENYGVNPFIDTEDDHFSTLEQFIFYAVCPVKADESARLAVVEFITRANFGLRIGNLEMDFLDGEVRYKSSIDFEGETLTPRLVRNTIYPAVQTVDRYLGGLLKVMYGGSTPADAIAEVEGG